MGTAGRLLRQRAPNELDALLKRPGHHTLKALMQAFECFEMREETTSKGGMRVVYRVKVTEPEAASVGAPGQIQ